MTYTNELHETLIIKDGSTFWKCWHSKFELHKNVVRLKVVLMMKLLFEILPNISRRSILPTVPSATHSCITVAVVAVGVYLHENKVLQR